MPRPWSLLPALVLVVAATLVGVVPAAASSTAPEDEDAGPLQVTIEELSPSVVPQRGRIQMRGTVTNTSEERWRAINVYAFMSAVPITSEEELAEAVSTPYDAEVGARIVDAGSFASVGSLDPGETASFTVRLTRDQLPASAPGVYWFGAHALGNTEAARDGVADGRARTFLPLVPRTPRGRGPTDDTGDPGDTDDTVQASIVVPVRYPVTHAAGGRIRATRRWAEDLAPDGRLGAPLELAAADEAGPVTWLVDPAVPDAVERLVAGNPPRTLGPPRGRGRSDPDEESEEPSPTDGAADAGDGEGADDPEAPVSPAAAAGAGWLDRLRSALTVDEVLALPYGDPDLAAVAAYDRSLYRSAIRQSRNRFEDWQVSSDPAAASLSGLLPDEAVDLVDQQTTVLLSDRALGADAPGTTAEVEGRQVVLSSTATAQGGPGPDDPLGAIAMRQRILSDAALRLLAEDQEPLVVVLPSSFRPEDPDAFWSGLDPDWLVLDDIADLPRGPEVAPDALDYPVDEQLAELDEGVLDAASALVVAGRTLEGVVADNDQVAEQTLVEALTAVSYFDRDRPLATRAETVGAISWVTTRLQGIRIRAPKGVTLSSATGSFAATLTNRLRHPVTVSVQPDSEGDVTIEQPAAVELPARGRQSVQFNATTSSPGVHYVRLVVTDADGTPLGADQRIPIRSAQVSAVIWVIMGVGVGLLFVAITVRVVRRVRSERA